MIVAGRVADSFQPACRTAARRATRAGIYCAVRVDTEMPKDETTRCPRQDIYIYLFLNIVRCGLSSTSAKTYFNSPVVTENPFLFRAALPIGSSCSSRSFPSGDAGDGGAKGERQKAAWRGSAADGWPGRTGAGLKASQGIGRVQSQATGYCCSYSYSFYHHYYQRQGLMLSHIFSKYC